MQNVMFCSRGHNPPSMAHGLPLSTHSSPTFHIQCSGRRLSRPLQRQSRPLSVPLLLPARTRLPLRRVGATAESAGERREAKAESPANEGPLAGIQRWWASITGGEGVALAGPLMPDRQGHLVHHHCVSGLSAALCLTCSTLYVPKKDSWPIYAMRRWELTLGVCMHRSQNVCSEGRGQPSGAPDAAGGIQQGYRRLRCAQRQGARAQAKADRQQGGGGAAAALPGCGPDGARPRELDAGSSSQLAQRQQGR